MKTISLYDSELIALLRTELKLSENALIKQEGKLSDDYPIRFDLIIEDGGRTYVVEIKRIVRLEALSQLGLLKLLLDADKISAYNIEFVVVGKRIAPEAAEAAKKTGIRFIKLPADVNLEEARNKSSALPAKLTSPKSWQAISYFLKIKEASIRQLAIGSGVSYGWTHATVKALASKGIVSSDRGLVKIADVNKLLNGIAWERPFEKLFAQEIRIAAESPMALAQEICLVCDEQRIACAFSSYTAGEIYTGYSARHDSVYMYLEKKNIAELSGMFDVENEGGIALRIYAPDRDVFGDRRMATAQGVWIVSPAQALLDCAGLGYAGRDLTLKLVEVYDRL
ncbi:MAG TPA: hypothetical protein PLY09_03955 [Methanothrix sp.]|nr:hypothetical protein [Methanothrix sp.]HPJ83897.1 hypothetical protein [Methanothrix sp.]